MTTVLYNFIIFPLEYIIENLLSLLFYVFKFNIEFVTIAISIIVSLLCFLFYSKKDKINKEGKNYFSTLKLHIYN